MKNHDAAAPAAASYTAAGAGTSTTAILRNPQEHLSHSSATVEAEVLWTASFADMHGPRGMARFVMHGHTR